MKKGFTLIEVLVSATILSMGMASMLYSFVACNDKMIRNTHRQNATMLINQQFEAIQNQENPTNLDLYINAYSTPQHAYGMYNSQLKQDYMISLSNAGPLTILPGVDLSVIQATVTWNSGSMTMSMLSNEP